MVPVEQIHEQEDEKEENAADWHDIRCGRLFTLLLLAIPLERATGVARLRFAHRALGWF